MQVDYEGNLTYKDTSGVITKLVMNDGTLSLQYFSNSSTYVGSVTIASVQH